MGNTSICLDYRVNQPDKAIDKEFSRGCFSRGWFVGIGVEMVREDLGKGVLGRWCFLVGLVVARPLESPVRYLM